MKTQRNIKSGLLALALGVALFAANTNAYAVSDSVAVDLDVVLNQEVGWVHAPVVGTISSAFLTVTATGVENAIGGDEYAWLRIAGISDPSAFVTVGLLEPTSGGVAGPIDITAFASLINDGLLVTVFADPDGNNPNAAFRVVSSVLDVTVRTPGTVPDAGSTLMMLGAGVAALVSFKRRMA
jgi:hypothetical protein